jgi:hypothetical protein
MKTKKKETEKKKAVGDVSVMCQIWGTRSCKSYGKKLYWAQNADFIFHYKFVVNIFDYQKEFSELRAEIYM